MKTTNNDPAKDPAHISNSYQRNKPKPRRSFGFGPPTDDDYELSGRKTLRHELTEEQRKHLSTVTRR